MRFSATGEQNVARAMERAADSQEKVAENVERTTRVTRQLTDAQERQVRTQRELADTAIRAAREQSELVGDVASRTSQLSGALAGLGAVGGGRLMIAADILDAAEAAQLLRAEFPSMIQQLVAMRGQLVLMGAAGGAAALAMLALKVHNDELERERRVAEAAREETARFVDGLVDFNRFVLGATTEDAQARIEELEQEAAALRRTRDQIRLDIQEDRESIQRRLAEQIPQTAESNRELFDAITDVIMGTEQIGDQFRELGVSGRAVNDVVIRFEESTFTLQESFANLTGEIIDAENEIASIRDEFPALAEDVTGFFRDVQQEGEGLVATFQNVASIAERTNQIETSAIQARERNLDRQQAELERRVEIEAELAEQQEATNQTLMAGALAISEFDQAVTEAEQGLADQIAQRESAFMEQRAKLITDSNDRMADIRAQGQQELVDLEAEHVQTMNELRADFQDEEGKRQRDFARDQLLDQEDHRDRLADAASRMDAIAILEEQRSFARDQRRAQEDFDAETQERREEHRQAMADERRDFQARRRQALQAMRERERDERTALAERLQEQRRAFVQELADLRSANATKLAEMRTQHDRELAQLLGFQTQETLLRKQHFNTLAGQIAAFSAQFGISPSLSGFAGGPVGDFKLPLAGGMGIPSTSTSQSNVNNSRSASVTNNVSGFGANEISGLIDRKVRQTMGQVLAVG
jgi:hypothetical protein